MYKYKKAMIAAFTLYFLSLSIHMVFSYLTLSGEHRIAALSCGAFMFIVPIIIFVSGKLRNFMPFIVCTFYIAACLVMSVFNKTAVYLPLLFACEAVISGFFLSSKLCAWLILMSDAVLALNGALFLAPEIGPLFPVYITTYIIMCLCYNFSALGMALFVYALQRNLSAISKKNKELARSNNRKNIFWAASAAKMRSSAEEVSEIATSILVRNDVSAPVRERLRDIQGNTGKLLMALNDAEDYARIESGHMALQKETYSFGGLISDIANFCAAACSDKNITFSLDCQEDIPSILMGDSRRISQIVMNLFGNAVKFTETGTVTLSFSARCDGDNIAYLRIQVKDTGIGLDPVAARKIFTVYAENNGDAPSVHLGLGMVKELVSLMGGFVFAGREKSGGTCFTVTIPQQIQNRQPFAQVNQPEKLRVLIYMKDQEAAKSAQQQLERLKVNFRSCISRADFMQEKDNQSYTHVFADYGYYLFDKPIFTMLARHVKVVALCNIGENSAPVQKNITVAFKPIHLAFLASIFEGNPAESGQAPIEFTAPDAKILVTGDNTESLKALEVYSIKPVFVNRRNLTAELEKNNFDMVFLGENAEGSAARMLSMEERLRDTPVIALGHSTEGCSAYLSADFQQWELGKILINLLPEEKIQYGSTASELSQYSELNPTRGIMSAGGNKSAYKEMLEIFENRTEGAGEKLERCIAAGDYEGCTIQLSSIKDVIAGIGAASAAEIARQTASAAGKQDLTLLTELTGLLKIKLSRLNDDIARYYEENGIEELTKENFGKGAENIRREAKNSNSAAAVRFAEDMLNTHMNFSQRLLLRTVYDYLNGGDFDQALIQLEKLEQEICKGGDRQ